MRRQTLMKKISVISLALSLIIFSLLTSVLIQTPTIHAQGKHIEQGEQQIITTNVEGEHVITLITGDIVTVSEVGDGESVITVEPSVESDDGTRIITIDEETYVIPNEAMPYLTSGLLDRQLFNITTLMESGDGDENATTPLIIQYSQQTKAKTFASKPELNGLKDVQVLDSIQSVALEEEQDTVGELWDKITEDSKKSKNKLRSTDVSFNSDIEKIWLDRKVELNLAESVPQVGAPEAWDADYDGEGVTVAVLDTGIDDTHPDILDRLIDIESFVPEDDGLDRQGHGTHVASTVLGTGNASDGNYTGVAPGADLIVGKVLGDDGSGQVSWVISGMEWAAQHADIINMSLSDKTPSDGTDPMSQALNELSAETGALFVVAAGNTGMEESIGSPSAADAALTVGNVNKSDRLALLSSMGPRVGDMAIKPDIAAPGENIMAARSQYASSGSGDYWAMSGTSMATPHVAGAASILKQKHPDWTGEQIKHALMSTTKELDAYQPHEVGTGRLDIASALFSDIYATGSVSFGFFKWPHEETDPVEKTVTYHNDGDEAVTLEISATFASEDGNDAPADMLELSDSSITVPANGSTEVTLTVHPELGEAGTRYWGQLYAKIDDETVTHTALGMVKEDERHPLTINVIDREGSPDTAEVLIFGSGDIAKEVVVNETAEVRLPKGTYAAITFLDVDVNTDHEGVALVVEPEIHLDGDTTINLDAREANEISAEVPKQTTPSHQRLGFLRSLEGIGVELNYILPPHVNKMYAVPAEEVESGHLELAPRWRLIKPSLSINLGEQELRVTPLPGMELVNEKTNLDTVYAGNGAPDKYQHIDVKDKAVVVDRSENITAAAQATAALEAGAKLLIIANHTAAPFSEFVGNEDNSDIPLVVASIGKGEGDKLIQAIEQGNTVLNVESTINTPYLYDLIDVHTNKIPEDLTYTPASDDLAKIDTRYLSDGQGVGYGFRYDKRPHFLAFLGVPEKYSIPSAREEWVSVEEGTSWYHKTSVIDPSQPNEEADTWEVRDTIASYSAGERLQEDWFSPVIRPSFGDGFWTPQRGGFGFMFNVPGYADSGKNHTGTLSNKDQTLKIYQGDTLIEEGKGQGLYTGILPKERLQYKLVSDAKHDHSLFKASSRTFTEWTFWSEDGVLNIPLLSLNYQSDMNTKGHLLANRPTELVIDVTKISGISGYGTLEDVSLKVSFDDGETWETTPLTEREDGWIAEITPSKNATSVSLQASAWDDEGNKINQEITRAFDVTKTGAGDLELLVEELVETGDISEGAVRALDMHLTTLKRFEETGAADKVIKHVNGLFLLLDHQEEEGLISHSAYNLLTSDANYLKTMWQ